MAGCESSSAGVSRALPNPEKLFLTWRLTFMLALVFKIQSSANLARSVSAHAGWKLVVGKMSTSMISHGVWAILDNMAVQPANRIGNLRLG